LTPLRQSSRKFGGAATKFDPSTGALFLPFMMDMELMYVNETDGPYTFCQRA